MPLAPIVAWGVGSNQATIGLGDLLLATVFPLVVRKAFGQAAGIAAMVINLITLAALIAILVLGNVPAIVPVMTALGPLMVLQYGYWLRRRGPERTTRQYLQAEPLFERRIASPSSGRR
jgi:hypothetical protein